MRYLRSSNSRKQDETVVARAAGGEHEAAAAECGVARGSRAQLQLRLPVAMLPVHMTSVKRALMLTVLTTIKK